MLPPDFAPNDPNDRTGESTHDALGLEEIVIFYNLAFELGGSLDPVDAMRRLLAEDIAIAAANYTTGEVELAPRFKDLKGLQRRLRQLAELADPLEQDNLSGIARWALRNPRVALMLLRWWRQPDNRKHEADSALTDPRHVAEELGEGVNFIEQAMVKAQIWESLQFESDKSLYSPLYLAQVPFTRVTLQPFKTTLEGHEVSADVELLIHRAGIGVLRFAVVLDAPLTVDEAIKLLVPSNVKMTRWEVVRQLIDMEGASLGINRAKLDRSPYREDYSGGVQWLINDRAENLTLMDLLLLYSSTINALLVGKTPRRPDEPVRWLRTGDWFAYPILFVRRSTPPLATVDAITTPQARALAGLVQRAQNWKYVKPRVIENWLRNDHSLTDKDSFYVEPGSATVVYYGAYSERFGGQIPAAEWLRSYFQRSAIVDALLVQRWILHTLQVQLAILPSSLTKLNALRRDLALALAELDNATFAYGSANEVVKTARKSLNIDDAYVAVSAGLANLEKLIETEESLARHKRNVMLSVAASAVTILLGLSGAHQVTSVLSDWGTLPTNNVPQWLGPVIAYADAHPVWLTLLLFAIVVVVVLPTTLWSVMPRRNWRPIVMIDKSSGSTRPGFTWPPDTEPSTRDRQDRPG